MNAGAAVRNKQPLFIEAFSTTVGDDIPVHVQGDYSSPDAGCGWPGNFTVERVWLAADVQQTDIQSLLTDKQMVRLSDEGFGLLQQSMREAANEAKEYREER